MLQKDIIQDYVARVASANKSELVVIVYELAILNIDEALKSYETEDIQTTNQHIEKSRKFIAELIEGLDFSYEISYELFRLYLYVNKVLLDAMRKDTKKQLDVAKSILEKLMSSFEQIAKEDKSGSVMQNTQDIYAGLTYGKGTLNETLINPNMQNRGFSA